MPIVVSTTRWCNDTLKRFRLARQRNETRCRSSATIQTGDEPTHDVLVIGVRSGGGCLWTARRYAVLDSGSHGEAGRFHARDVWPLRRQGRLPLHTDQCPWHGSACHVIWGDDRVATRARPRRPIRRRGAWIRRTRRLSGARAVLRRDRRAVR